MNTSPGRTIARTLLLVLSLGVGAVGCPSGSGDIHECNDGIDNDGDGAIDQSDPGCLANQTFESPDPDIDVPECSDEIDNDGDGLIDLADPGCQNGADDQEFQEPQAQCRDGIDNDDDGLIDFPNDPGCFLSLQNSESDDCPFGPLCPACGNNQDDDGDGLIDYPQDLGCNAASDNDEFNADPSECGGGVSLSMLPETGGEVFGTLDSEGLSELVSNGCGGTGSEVAYKLDLPTRKSLVVNTDFPETNVDTVVYVRGDCRDRATELGCNDDIVGSFTSKLQVDVEAGTYYVVVDTHSGDSGDFRMTVDPFTQPGDECDPMMPACLPGFFCRFFDQTSVVTTCEVAECQDGNDNDGDGLPDFPNDPGCIDLDDNVEADDCPGGPGCPQCGNQVDDDGDTLIDFPADLGCLSASDNDEVDECIPGVLITTLTDAGASGTTPISGSNFTPSCHTSTASTEDVYQYLLNRDLASITFSTFGSPEDTVTSVRFGDCADIAAEVGCDNVQNGGEDITIPAPAQGVYYIFVDGDFVSSVDYVLNVRGTLSLGQTCDPADAQFVCESGLACDPGTNTCELSQCNNGVDDDADTFTDFPDDPGCADISDNDETDDCPAGPQCPACGNQVDDDADTVIDYPTDPGCKSASDDSEIDFCIPGVDVEVLPETGVVGTTPPSTEGSNFTPSCHTSTLSTEDVYHFDLDVALTSITFSTLGSLGDTVLSVRSPDCGSGASELACAQFPNFGEFITLQAPAQGDYFVFVDGDFISEIPYVLNVSGIIAAGDACDPASVAFTCESGFTCDTGTNTCVTALCANGADDDTDGLIDYPLDPGCASASDDDEADDCPVGPGCPACGNGVDDDGDAAIDFPADIGCLATSDGDEIDECIAGVPLLPLPAGGTSGTTPPSSAGSKFTPSCHTSSTSTENVHLFRVDRALTSITFTTEGSISDTVLSVQFDSCGDLAAEVGCNHIPSAGEPITLANPALGNYFVFVDGDFVSSASYVLNVFGTIAAGDSCDPADANFVCEPGLACDLGTNTCVTALCSDGVDNDGDGRTDFPLDPGCADTSDNDETDDCPAGPGCPQCGNATDDDGDGFTDFPIDFGCLSASDDDEADECIPGVPTILLTDAGAAGTTPPSSAGSNFTPSCHTSTASTEDVYQYLLDDILSSITFSTVGSAGDTVLSVQHPTCGNVANELGCAQAPAAGEEITIPNPVQGFYFVFVDGDFISNINYVLNVSGTISPGGACDPADTQFTCEVGFACDAGTNTCVPTQCNDGVDNDADAFIDFPDDPGCLGIDDDDEADDCPAGPECVQCGNAIDDDADALIDFPADLACDAASDVSELDECIAGVPLQGLPLAGVTGTTPVSSDGSDFTPSCHTSTASTEDEYHFPLTKTLTSLTFSTIGSLGDTVLSVQFGTCGSIAAEVGCAQVPNTGEEVTIANPMLGDYFVFVDGDFISNISYVLNVRGTLGGGQTCDPANTQFTCEPGFTCDGGTNTCVATACNDGVDSDGDTLIDFPDDPGCLDVADLDEADDCPTGPNCGQCGNGVDDDADTFIDYPVDVACEFASDVSELDECIAGVPLKGLPLAGVTGVTPASGSDFTPSCHTSTVSTEDEYHFPLTKTLSALTFSTVGSLGDTVLSVQFGTCGSIAAEVGCLNVQNGGEAITINTPAVGDYFVFVDGDFVTGIPYVLNVSGTIASGDPCDPTDTVFVCEAPLVCDGGTLTCQ